MSCNRCSRSPAMRRETTRAADVLCVRQTTGRDSTPKLSARGDMSPVFSRPAILPRVFGNRNVHFSHVTSRAFIYYNYACKDISTKQHINFICKTVFFELRRISTIQQYLTVYITKTFTSFLLLRLFVPVLTPFI